MAILSIVTKPRRQAIIEGFTKDLASYTIYNKKDQCFSPVVCAVCEAIPDRPDWSSWVEVDHFADLCKKCNMTKHRLTCKNVYPEKMVDQYTANEEILKSFVLSSATQISCDVDPFSFYAELQLPFQSCNYCKQEQNGCGS